MVIDNAVEINSKTVMDALFDMGAKIVNVNHNTTLSEILFDYNNQKAVLYFANNKKTLQISHNDIIIKSTKRVKTYAELVAVLTDLLKRVF